MSDREREIRQLQQALVALGTSGWEWGTQLAGAFDTSPGRIQPPQSLTHVLTLPLSFEHAWPTASTRLASDLTRTPPSPTHTLALPTMSGGLHPPGVST